jgi:hypothetical protein
MQTATINVKKLLHQCDDYVKNVSKKSYPCEVFVNLRGMKIGLIKGERAKVSALRPWAARYEGMMEFRRNYYRAIARDVGTHGNNRLQLTDAPD